MAKAAKKANDMAQIKYLLVLVIILLLAVIFAVYPAGALIRIEGDGGGTGSGTTPTSGVTYQGVLNMLNRCDNYLASVGESCNDACNNAGKTCIIADHAIYSPSGSGQVIDSIEDCSTRFDEGEYFMECVCCSP